jgi:thiol:disulfide interchange protein
MIVAVLVLLVAFGCSKKEAEPQPAAHQHAHIEWITDIDQALEMAEAQHKPLMVDFMATWCNPCKMMEDSTFSHESVIHKAESFIPVRIDVDKQGDVANAYKSNAGKYGGIGIPNVLFLDAHGHELKHPVGFRNAEQFIAIMDSVLMLAAQHQH